MQPQWNIQPELIVLFDCSFHILESVSHTFCYCKCELNFQGKSLLACINGLHILTGMTLYLPQASPAAPATLAPQVAPASQAQQVGVFTCLS